MKGLNLNKEGESEESDTPIERHPLQLPPNLLSIELASVPIIEQWGTMEYRSYIMREL